MGMWAFAVTIHTYTYTYTYYSYIHMLAVCKNYTKKDSQLCTLWSVIMLLISQPTSHKLLCLYVCVYVSHNVRLSWGLQIVSLVQIIQGNYLLQPSWFCLLYSLRQICDAIKILKDLSCLMLPYKAHSKMDK